MRDSTTFGIGIALVVGLAGCSGGGDSSAPPSTTLAAETAARKDHPAAKIMVMKTGDDCDLERVNPRRYPKGKSVPGDTVAWEMKYQTGCDAFETVILTSFYRLPESDCTSHVPLMNCTASFPAVPSSGEVRCTIAEGYEDNDWEYYVCAYDKDGKGVSELDPRLQTRPSEEDPLPPPGGPDPDSTRIDKVCKEKPGCPATYEAAESAGAGS